MTQYQSFPGVKGASESLAKLEALRLPPLQGKRFLDVGCNEGFFCGYARFDGATEVIGIDASRATIARAQIRFPDCCFLARSWDQLPEGRFDVILLASALHYADDQAALIHRLIASLTDEGTLVLEIGLASSGKSEWVRVKRSIDERLFPSRGKLAEILDDYAWKIVGDSVQQAGDPLRRYVVHVRRQKPFVFLLLEPPASGKTTLGRTLFARAKVPVVSGDLTYLRMSTGKVAASEALVSCINTDFSPQYNLVAERVLAQGLVGDLVDVWCQQGGGGEFALDSYVPEKYQQQVRDAFLDRGYIPVMLTWEMEKSMSGPGEAASRAAVYVDALAERAVESDAPSLQVTRLKSPALVTLLSGWHLDSPANGQVLIEDEPLTVAGWGLTNDLGATDLQCYTRAGETLQVFRLDRPRRDVIDARLKDHPHLHEKLLHCGFRFTCPIDELAAGIEFGFLANGEEIPVARFGPAAPAAGKPSLSRSLLSKVGASLWPRR
ncbi:MAG: class I SAM-dependent methyltransferase [Candidatus Accumulibacter sp. UW20]|jgi:SAM-dependent methyltransferase